MEKIIKKTILLFALFLSSCGTNIEGISSVDSSSTRINDNLYLLSFEQDQQSETKQLSSRLLNDLEKTNETKEIKIDNHDNVKLLAKVKNTNRLSFIDIVIKSEALKTSVVFNEGNGNYICSTNTVMDGDIWVTDIVIDLPYSLIELSHCNDHKEIEITEINFLAFDKSVSKADLVEESNIRNLRFSYNEETNYEGHDWGDWTIITSPTCTSIGRKKRICKNNENHIEYQDVNMLPHEDHDTGKCVNCGANTIEQYLVFRLNESNNTYDVIDIDDSFFDYEYKTVVFPAEHNGIPVKRIAASLYFFETAQKNRDCPHLFKLRDIALENIIVEDGYEYIDDYSFGALPNVKSIVLPDSVTYIGRWAISGCKKLTSFRIPRGVTGSYVEPEPMFTGNESLEKVYVHENFVPINGCFACESLFTIYCEADSKPSEWPDKWNYSYYEGDEFFGDIGIEDYHPVVWGYDI